MDFSSKSLEAFKTSIADKKTLLIEGLWSTPKALIASLASEFTQKHILILTGGSQEEVSLFNDFALFTKYEVVDFPAWETLPSENIPPSPDIVGERYQVLRKITNSPTPLIIISGLQACLQLLLPPDALDPLHLSLKPGMQLPFESLLSQLEKMGYQKRPVASDKGEFAVRGGIVDIFPVSSPDPVRLEFWGDEIESIRFFDPIGQKSIRAADSIDITPAQELELLAGKDKLCSILDYLGPNTLIILDDLAALEDRYANLLSITGKLGTSFSDIETFMDRIEHFQKIYLTHTSLEELSDVQVSGKTKNLYSRQAPLHEVGFQMFNRQLAAARWRHPFVSVNQFISQHDPESEALSGEELVKAVCEFDFTQGTLHLIFASELEQENFLKKIQDQQLHLPKNARLHPGYLTSGFGFITENTLYLPFTEISQRYKIRRQKQRGTYHTLPTEAFELNPGDLVVHLNNGIARYIGLERRPNHLGIEAEFFLLEYAEGAKLYVPLNQSYLLTKYVGAGEESPRLHALGSNRWKKIREQTQAAISAYAQELLQIYAQREMRGGYSYPADSREMLDFEEDFPYVETEDQLQAIAAIKEDMLSSKPMDRLICGDVGYGKTEVAMRAAFKAVVDGQKQVAVLVPTTVLAMQHYENFRDRMANFPVRVGVLSRFLSAKEVKATLEGLASGAIDIVIGTHRIISEDIVFKDLGLIIIDEEQRFGVKAKEHLKKVKVGVDCLTLSATPIPRTLYMSLVGGRDMSIISTPPQDRLPIKTVLAEANEQTFKNALLRELARDGQAFIIHNRVETIFDMASKIKKLLPQARIVVGHGQMSADEIDSVFHAFKSGQADILIATTIIENGIDIPNANTILIDRADRFGLAELYQLRGRVGRWNRRAYAYFFVPKLASLPEISRQRLQALAENSGYGGGMKVAMRDLELRGGGNILGTEQSGHVAAVGFHLYCKMLKRTMQKLQGSAPASLSDTKIDCQIDARFPEEYVNEISLRMELYQRLGEAISWEEADAIWKEVIDRFGKPPLPAEWLYRLTRVRIFASANGFAALKFDKMTLSMEYARSKTSEIKKVLLPAIKKPQEWEVKVIAAMQGVMSETKKKGK